MTDSFYGAPEEFINNMPIMGYEDDSGLVRFMTKGLASNNFDGWISSGPASVSVSDVVAGQSIAIYSGSTTEFYPILSVSKQDPLLDSGSFTGEVVLFYIDSQETKSITYASSATQVVTLKEDWADKYLGESGWYISQEGNAIFANVAVRGRIEATSGYIGGTEFGWEIDQNLIKNASVGFYAPEVTTGEIAIFAGARFQDRASAAFRVGYDGTVNASSATIRGNLTATTLDVGGANGIVYNGSAVTIGASVNILAPVTVNALQVGASPTLLRIANDVNGTNDGIYINDNNYWYSDGQFGVGGSANNVVWSGSTLAVTGDINATTITASNGTIAGFTLSNNQFSIPGITFSSSGGLRLGNPVTFSVDQNGNMVATSASISGDITANSGRFTGSISAQHITASVGSIAGFTLENNQMSTASVVVSSSGGFRLGNPVVFSVDQFGNVRATSASITGDINATSGSFSGKITATTGEIGGWSINTTFITGTSASLDSAGAIKLGTGQNIVALSSTDPNRIWAGSANSTTAPFRVDSTGGLFATSASIKGDITATSGSFTGDITALNGRFQGQVLIETGGNLRAGTGAQNISIDSTGLYGYNNLGLLAVKIPTDGTDPLIGKFKILETGLVSQTSESGANIVVGEVIGSGSAASVQSGIVIRGYRSLNASVAIYTVQAGSATTYTEGNGIYFDETGKFKIKGATGSIRFDGDDLYISGNVNARSGNFTGSIVAQHITASTGSVGGWGLSASTLSGNNATLNSASGSLILGSGQNIVALSSTDTNRIWAGSANSATAPFRISNTGFLTATGASITGNITAQSGNFTGSVSAQHITASVGLMGGFILSASSITDSTVTASTVGMTTGPTAFFAGANDQIGTNAQFRVTQTGSVFANAASITGDIVATTITANTGSIGGWGLTASSFIGNSASLNSAGSLILGSGQNIVALSSTDTNRIWAGSANSSTAPFRVSNTGFLTATGASITGNITAQSGTFTGSISAQHITASVGSIAGFTLANNQMSTASIIVSSSGGFRLGSPTVFSVNQFGNLVANSASIIGNINAQSGSFTGTLGVFGSGNIYVGASTNAGARIVINSADLTGYSPNNATTFKLVSGSGSTILDNPGFDGANLSPWVRFWGFSGTQSSASQDAVFYKEGGKALRILATPGSPSRLHTIDQYLGTKLTVGTEYIISAWVYSASPLVGVSGSSGAEMWIISSSTTASPTYFGASTTGYTALTPPTAVPANVWTKLTAKFIPTVTNSTLSLRMWTSASTRVWWDSVDISESSNYSQISGFFFNDGALYTDYLRIGSDGNVSLGLQSSASASSSEGADLSNILEMSGTDENYRFWVGNSNPDKALMNITKSGTININSGGDLILTSSAVGTSDSVLSKISFKTTGDSTSQGRVDYVPTSSWMNIGIATGANAFRQLRLTAGTTGSITLRGTVLGFDSNFVLDQNNTRIGIGTLDPTNTLTVVGTASISSTLSTGGNTTITGGLLSTNRNVGAVTERGLRINSTNNYTTNWNAIEFQRNGVDLGFIRVASAAGAPTLVSASDYRLKKNIEDDTRDFSNIINSLRPVTFEWKNIENAGKTYGFIAHEVQQYIPEAVGGIKDDVDENGEIIPQDLTQQPFVYYLVGAFKEALKEIDILKQRVLQLESTIERNNNV